MRTIYRWLRRHRRSVRWMAGATSYVSMVLTILILASNLFSISLKLKILIDQQEKANSRIQMIQAYQTAMAYQAGVQLESVEITDDKEAPHE